MNGDDFMDYTIIAVDFDGTLCYSNWPELGEPNKPLIEYLRAQQRSGNKLIPHFHEAIKSLTYAHLLIKIMNII